MRCLRQQAVCRLPKAPADPDMCLVCMQASKDAFIFEIPSLQHMTEDDDKRRWGAAWTAGQCAEWQLLQSDMGACGAADCWLEM